jgi:exodeoxyribonuclease VII large subunit
VRAVAACRTPVVSAIGHEKDSPLLDLVADLRASTPTDAGKRVVPDLADELRGLTQARDRLTRAVTHQVAAGQTWLGAVRTRSVLADPHQLVDRRRVEVEALVERSRRTVHHRLERAADDVGHVRARVRALSPAATLERGYAVVQDEAGTVVRDADGVETGALLRVRLAAGELAARREDSPRLPS